nr:hypothetical protein P5648_02430 [Bacillus subtilis]
MKKKLFSTISIGVLGVTFFANSYTTQAAPEHIKQVKHIELNTGEDEYTTKNAFAAGVVAGIVSAKQFMMALKPLEIGWENKQTKLMHNLYIVRLLLENMHVI